MTNTVAAPTQINPISAPASDAVGGQQLSGIQPMQMAGVPTMSINSNVASTPGGLSQAQILQQIATNQVGSAAGNALLSGTGASGYGSTLYDLAQGNTNAAGTSAASTYAGNAAGDALGSSLAGGAVGAGVGVVASGQDNSHGWGSAAGATAGTYAGTAIGDWIVPGVGGVVGGYIGGALGGALGSVFGGFKKGGSVSHATAVANSDGGCLITQAVLAATGEGDGAHELQILRAWRDGFLLKNPKLVPLVDAYYSISPLAVNAINQRPDAKQVYISIYHSFVLPEVQAITQGNMQQALQIYMTFLKNISPRQQDNQQPQQPRQPTPPQSNLSGPPPQGALSQLPQGAQ